MASEKEPVILKRNNVNSDTDTDESSFDELLDTTCWNLWEKRVEYSIRRIMEMDEELGRLEAELENSIKIHESNTRGSG